jgi:Polyketide synthase dehydratase
MAARVEGLARLLAGAPGSCATALYQDGTLFHGPALRGITRILVEDPTRLVLECRLSDRPLAGGAYEGRRYSPVLADLLLQAPLVWVRHLKGYASLPVGIEHVELFDRLPHDEPFAVVVDQIHDSGVKITCTVSACTADGRVLQRLGNVSVVLRPQLEDKLALSRHGDTVAA